MLRSGCIAFPLAYPGRSSLVSGMTSGTVPDSIHRHRWRIPVNATSGWVSTWNRFSRIARTT
jgi:hypothetical protein